MVPQRNEAGMTRKTTCLGQPATVVVSQTRQDSTASTRHWTDLQTIKRNLVKNTSLVVGVKVNV